LPLNRRILLGSVTVALAASLFGMLGFVSRSAAVAGLDALPFAAWRAGVATAVLLGLTLLLAATGRDRLPDPRLLGRSRQLALLAACVCGALLNIALFAAFLRTTIALVLITFYTFPVIVTLAAVRLYGERLDRRRVFALVLSTLGLGLVVLAPVLQSTELLIDPLGLTLALFAAFCQAAFLLLAARGFAPLRSLHVATYVIGAAVVIALLLAPLTGDLPGLLRPLQETAAWPWILLGGILGAAIPTTALLAGMELIGPSRAAILMTFEPVVGVALAAMLLGERPAPLQLVGGVAVLTAAAILQAAPRPPLPAEPAAPRLV
jgi:drug/metabolite transporter (DMT)-like permease